VNKDKHRLKQQATSNKQAMDAWTPAQRDAWIKTAVTSTETYGRTAPYAFKVLPKLNGSDMEDAKKSIATETFARVIFSDPRFKVLSLRFYEMLVFKLRTSAFVCQHFQSNFFVILKGSTAYRMLVGDAYAADFPYSDLDIVIYINPYLEDGLFNALRTSINTILCQVISQYKRIIDHMFFLNRPGHEAIMTEDTIADFKAAMVKAFDEIEHPDGYFMTPFENEATRNMCSTNSFLIAPSEAQENNVVRIEIPHFDKCERIPLRRTPVHASHNQSIEFNRDVTQQTVIKGKFDLFRLKFGCMFVTDKCSSSGSSDCLVEDQAPDVFRNRIAMDFIDVMVADKSDAELIDFWHHGRCTMLIDPHNGSGRLVPDLPSCLNDLHKMLYIYDCPEHKRAKRQRKYQIISSLILMGAQQGVVHRLM
jgi:hypothetical protein